MACAYLSFSYALHAAANGVVLVRPGIDPKDNQCTLPQVPSVQLVLLLVPISPFSFFASGSFQKDTREER